MEFTLHSSPSTSRVGDGVLLHVEFMHGGMRAEVRLVIEFALFLTKFAEFLANLIVFEIAEPKKLKTRF